MVQSQFCIETSVILYDCPFVDACGKCNGIIIVLLRGIKFIQGRPRQICASINTVGKLTSSVNLKFWSSFIASDKDRAIVQLGDVYAPMDGHKITYLLFATVGSN